MWLCIYTYRNLYILLPTFIVIGELLFACFPTLVGGIVSEKPAWFVRQTGVSPQSLFRRHSPIFYLRGERFISMRVLCPTIEQQHLLYPPIVAHTFEAALQILDVDDT